VLSLNHYIQTSSIAQYCEKVLLLQLGKKSMQSFAKLIIQNPFLLLDIDDI